MELITLYSMTSLQIERVWQNAITERDLETSFTPEWEEKNSKVQAISNIHKNKYGQPLTYGVYSV